MKRTTIKDVAAYLHYSVSTVSRALSDDKYVHPETRKRVLEAAEKLGYRRNHIASRLRTGLYGTIGVVVNEMLTPFAASVIEGIQNVMHEHNIQVLIANSHDNPELERRNLLNMENSMVDGLIVGPCATTENNEAFLRLQEKGLPLVFFSRSVRGLRVPRVVVNDYSKAFFLMDHFLHSGRRRIVHIRGPHALTNFDDIYKAYQDAHAKYGLAVDRELVITSDVSVNDGRRTAMFLLDSGLEFDAVFACNDLLAIGVMNTLRDNKVSVPEDVAVAGFSGSPLSQLVYPALTTVEPELFDMGEKAARLLLQMIQLSCVEADTTIIVDARIQLRGSSH